MIRKKVIKMDLTTEQKRKIKKILRNHNIKKASIFGSYARGEANNNSDIDILVEPDQKSLFELVAIKQDLEDELELKVDINTFNGLNYSEREGLKDEVLKEQVEIIRVKEKILILKDILNSIKLIESYSEDISKREFLENQEKQDAIINRLMIIGEATKLLSDDIRKKYSDIPWSKMAGMRDIMIHRYHGVDLEIVWETIEEELMDVKKKINKIINQLYK